MAIIKASKGGKSLSAAINYAGKDKIISGINCPDDPKMATQQMNSTKELWGAEGGRLYKSYIQSFIKGETTAEQAQEIGRAWAEENFPNREIIVGTHTDSKSGCIHNHIIVNSVNMENGSKLQTSNADLERFKEVSNRICLEHGLSVIDRTTVKEPGTIVAWDRDKYQLLLKGVDKIGVSYVCDIARTLGHTLDECQGQDLKILQQSMKEKGYGAELTVDKKGNEGIMFTVLKTGEQVSGASLAYTFTQPRYSLEGIAKIIDIPLQQKQLPESTQALAIALDRSIAECKGKGYQAFQKSMNDQNYSVDFRGNKNITFASLQTGKDKMRSGQLAKVTKNDKYIRENIESVITKSRQVDNPTKEEPKQYRREQATSMTIDQIAQITTNIKEKVSFDIGRRESADLSDSGKQIAVATAPRRNEERIANGVKNLKGNTKPQGGGMAGLGAGKTKIVARSVSSRSIASRSPATFEPVRHVGWGGPVDHGDRMSEDEIEEIKMIQEAAEHDAEVRATHAVEEATARQNEADKREARDEEFK